tara:strand:+ start:2353 stop:3075 length:723 start_codon:yes stop_codon:yes gene_type:complete
MLKVKKRILGKKRVEFYLNEVPKEIRKETWHAVNQAGWAMFAAIRANASRTDYSLKELDTTGPYGMNNPFAKKHGSIQSQKLAMRSSDWLKKPWMVHKRSGDFLDSIVVVRNNVGSRGKSIQMMSGKRIFTKSKRMAFRIKYAYKSPHVRKVVTGTKTAMLPRNVIGETYAYLKKPLKKALTSEVVNRIKRNKTFSKVSKGSGVAGSFQSSGASGPSGASGSSGALDRFTQFAVMGGVGL